MRRDWQASEKDRSAQGVDISGDGNVGGGGGGGEQSVDLSLSICLGVQIVPARSSSHQICAPLLIYLLSCVKLFLLLLGVSKHGRDAGQAPMSKDAGGHSVTRLGERRCKPKLPCHCLRAADELNGSEGVRAVQARLPLKQSEHLALQMCERVQLGSLYGVSIVLDEAGVKGGEGSERFTSDVYDVQRPSKRQVVARLCPATRSLSKQRRSVYEALGLDQQLVHLGRVDGDEVE
jgi:hypothetical protein